MKKKVITILLTVMMLLILTIPVWGTDINIGGNPTILVQLEGKIEDGFYKTIVSLMWNGNANTSVSVNYSGNRGDVIVGNIIYGNTFQPRDGTIEIIIEQTCSVQIVNFELRRTSENLGVEGMFTINVPAGDHNYSPILTVPPNCYRGGGTAYRCSYCLDLIYRDPVPPLGHDYPMYGNLHIRPTCTEEGEARFYCQRESCDEFITQSIPALGHTEVTEKKEATDTEDGYIKVYCSVCGEVISLEVIQALKSEGERSADILKGLSYKDIDKELILLGKTLKLVIDGKEFILSTNANNKNQSGTIALGDGYFLVFDIKGNGSNIKEFKIIQK